MTSYFEGEPLRLGEGPQLLLDDSLVEDRWKLTRVLHRPTKFVKNPILYRDKPWEGDMVYSPWVIWDEEMRLFRMWYECFSLANYYKHGKDPIYWVCYAESEDGIHWIKPLMDVCPFPGFEKTNVVYCGTHRNRVQGVQIIKNAKASDPAEKYMMVCLEGVPRNGSGSLSGAVCLAYSADGLSWKLSDGEPILDYHSDCLNHLAYDERQERWLMYCRPIYMYAALKQKPVTSHWDMRHKVRRVAVMSSKDLVRWSYPRTVMYPDEQDIDYDQCTVFRYGSHLLMLYSAMDGDHEGTNEIRFASSPDGIHWTRFYTREPYLPRGVQGEWEGGQVFGACPPIRVGEDLYQYYSGTVNPQHLLAQGTMGGIGLSVMKADRFVEQRAGDEPGYLLTKEFILEGSRLSVNIAMNNVPYKEQGMKVEIVSHPPLGGHPGSTQAIEGYTFNDCDLIKGADTQRTVTWNGNSNLSPLVGKPVYIRFKLQNMGLFSFQLHP